MLYSKLKADLVTFLKSGEKEKAGAIKLLLGELARLKGNPNIKIESDDIVISTIQKVCKFEKETLSLQNLTSSLLLEVLESYLPKMLTEAEIKSWILSNKILDKVKLPMQAIGFVKKEFGSKVDGNLIKKVIMEL